MEPMYKIVRHFFRGSRKEVIREGLTLDEAQAHCDDPETSSRTCTGEEAKQRTEDHGPWFDCYHEEG